MFQVMDAYAHRAAIRFITALDYGVDAESFGDADAWSFMQDLVNEFASQGKGLNQVQLVALRNFGIGISMRPGSSLGGYKPALEAAFGPCQMSAEDFDTLVRWAHAQVNGGGPAVQTVRNTTVKLDSEFGTTDGWHKKTDLK
jgi:hypothetical protein